MARGLAAAALLALLVGCGATKTVVRTVTASPVLQETPEVQPFYGRVVSMTPTSGGYLLRFDPAFWLTGITANAAAAHAMGVTCAPAKCEAVPNDHFVVDESLATLDFVVPSSTNGTVLTSGAHLAGTRITAAHLAALVAQGKHAKLFEPLESGVWIRVRNDHVVAFAQQYVP